MEESQNLYQKARQIMDEGNLEDAIVLFERSISHYPHFKSLELLGECFYRLNRFPQAIVPLAAATSLNKAVRAPALLAEVFIKLKDFHKAVEIAEVALSRDPNNRKAKQSRKMAFESIRKN
jgi:tetratricopeptide (TPR) repeat protein